MLKNSPLDKEAARQRFQAAVTALGGDETKASHFFDVAWQSGELPTRFYHTPKHYLDVAEDNARPFDATDHYRALRYITGFHHDIVYQHVDQKAVENGGFSAGVREMIEKLVTLETSGARDIVVHFCPNKVHNETTRALMIAANLLCDVSSDTHSIPAEPVKLNKFNGQNEYLSALYAISADREMGIDPRYILSEIVMIAGTIPFKSSMRFAKTTDTNSSSVLEPLLRQIGTDSPELALTEEAIEYTMQQAVYVANSDVGNFRYGFFRAHQDDFVGNSFHLLLENMSEQADASRIDNASPFHLASAMRNMKDFMEGVAAADGHCIFHTRDGSAHPDEALAKSNIAKLSDYLGAACQDINLLEIDYTMKNGVHPKSWGDIRQHASQQLFDGIANGDIHVSAEMMENIAIYAQQDFSARQLFSILGSEVLLKHADSFTPAPNAVRVYLTYLKEETRTCEETTEKLQAVRA